MIDVKVFLDTLGGHEMTNFFGVLEVKIKKGSRSDLGRPTSSPIQNKESFNERLSMI